MYIILLGLRLLLIRILGILLDVAQLETGVHNYLVVTCKLVVQNVFYYHLYGAT